MFRIEIGWVLRLLCELKVWISKMFPFDLKNLERIRRNWVDIWIQCWKTVRMIYALWISGNFHGGATARLTGEDDRSCSSGVCIILGFGDVYCHVFHCMDKRLDDVALTEPRVCWSAEWHADWFKWNCAFWCLNLDHWSGARARSDGCGFFWFYSN